MDQGFAKKINKPAEREQEITNDNLLVSDPDEESQLMTEPAKQIESLHPIGRDNRELLMVREKQADAVVKDIEASDLVILGIAARTGSTSLQELIREKLEQQGMKVIIDSCYKLRRKSLEILDEAERQDEPIENLKVVFLMDEANRMKENFEEQEGRGDEDVDYFLNSLSEDMIPKIKYVLFTHDYYESHGLSGTDEMLAWIKEYAPAVTEKKVIIDQLESVDREQLGQIFDIIVRQSKLPVELVARRDELIDMFATPQQLNLFLEQYNNSYQKNKDAEAAWQDGIKRGFRRDAFFDPIRTSGGEKMWLLMRKIAKRDGGMIPVDQLEPEEQDMIKRYEKFHLFETDSANNVSIRGKRIQELARENEWHQLM